ncbi:hypothetical protein MSPP1_002735 [Malassezia sp. CBS 17886]|nr:hypothetical protein MSPP1_002735 [Malassezia sp. CBS 17886]
MASFFLRTRSAAHAATRGMCMSAARARESRVSALDFKLGTRDAVYRARLAALELLLPEMKGRWGAVAYATAQAAGLGWMTDSEEDIMRFEAARAVFYPMWVKCRGDSGSATVTFVSTNSTLPGNGWKPMDTLPVYPPPPRAPGEQATEAVIRGLADAMPYAPYSPERHLHASDIQMDGDISVLPFTMSPLSLPHLLRTADVRNLMVNMLAEGPALHIKRRITLLPGVEIQVANMDENHDPDATANVRLESDSLEVDLLACYPVLLPFHLVQFRYDSAEKKDCMATVALGAWDEQLLVYAVRCEGDKSWRSKYSPEPLNIEMLDFSPRVPVAAPVVDSGAEGGDAGVSDARIVDLMAQQSQLQAIFENRAAGLVADADWTPCEDWEAEQAAARPSAATPETDGGLGSTINWDAENIRPYYEGVTENREYVALVGESIFSARLLEGIEKARPEAHSEQHSTHEDEVVSGDDATDALRERLTAVQQRRDEKKPKWVK